MHRYFLKRKYGMSSEQFQRVLEAQAHRCAICRSPFEGTLRPCVDHDHATGEVRWLLCGGCNLGIGNFREDPVRLRAAAAMLEARK
jgi:hypothetical protein